MFLLFSEPQVLAIFNINNTFVVSCLAFELYIATNYIRSDGRDCTRLNHGTLGTYYIGFHGLTLYSDPERYTAQRYRWQTILLCEEPIILGAVQK